eukprot:1080094-Rhodomonas_salina.1
MATETGAKETGAQANETGERPATETGAQAEEAEAGATAAKETETGAQEQEQELRGTVSLGIWARYTKEEID